MASPRLSPSSPRRPGGGRSPRLTALRTMDMPEFDVFFMACADHLVTEFDQIKSISAFKDVHSNTGIFGIHASTVSIIIFTCTS